MFQRLQLLFQAIVDMLFERVEDQVPLERRLAQERLARGKKLKQMGNRADTIGQQAQMMVEGLADARVAYANLEQNAEDALKEAQKTKAAGNMVLHDQKMADASVFAKDAVEAQEEVSSLELMVKEALANHEEALQMVLRQSRELERMAMQDRQLVASDAMSRMRQLQQREREEMLSLYPEQESNIRQRVRNQVKERDAKNKATKMRVDALWKQKQQTQMVADRQQTAASADLLDRLKSKVGYTEPTPSASSTEATENAVETLRSRSEGKG